MSTPQVKTLQPKNIGDTGMWFSRLSVPITILVLVILGAIISPQFLTTNNFLNILNANSTVGLVALGMTFVAVSGGMADLSVPANMAMGALITLGLQPALGIELAILVGLAIATLGGIINGLLIGYLGVNSIITTLGTGAALIGIAQWVTGGGIVYLDPTPLTIWLSGKLFEIPVFVWIFVIVALILHPLLSKTAFGRWTFAVGGNYTAAEASSVPVRFTKASAFVLTGFLSGLCGILIALSNTQARPIIGSGYEFIAITAVVVGGTSLFGGSGSVLRTVGGVVIIAIVGNLIILSGLPTQSRDLVTGVIVILAVAADTYFRRKAGRE